MTLGVSLLPAPGAEANSPFTRDERFSVQKRSEFPFPFKHFIYDDFLSEATYLKHAAEIADRLRFGLFEHQVPHRLCRVVRPGSDGELYSAYCLNIPSTIWAPLNLWFAPHLRRQIMQDFDLELFDLPSVTIHHQRVNSQDGWIHNDYVAHPQLPLTRAVGFIYYFNNQEWRMGNGGETALFMSDGETLSSKINPHNNRLFIFEISPHSFHAFCRNSASDRNAIIGFFYADRDRLTKRYGVEPRLR